MTKVRTALVTGGTRGIGKGITERLAKNGMAVVFTGRDTKVGEQVQVNLRGLGANASFIQSDLLDADSLPMMIDQAVATLGSLDVLVHNAGIYPTHTLEAMTLTDWHRVLDTNLTSAVLLVKHGAPHLRQSATGRIVFISSITGPRTGISGLAHYCASKGGIDGLMRAAAVELAGTGITVNAVAPGTILTDSLEELYSTPGVMESVVRIIPVGRLGLPEDVAAAVDFFASVDAGFVTGQSLIVDGGQTIPEVQGES